MSAVQAPVVAALRQLPGVSAAEADHEAGGAVAGLRVWLTPGSDRSAVEAAVRRVATAHFGGDAGTDRVRIVEAADTAAPDASTERIPSPANPVRRSARPQIERTVVETAAGAVSVTVVLSTGSRSATGRATGRMAGSGLSRAVAAATVRAVDSLLPEQVGLEAEHVEVQRTHGHLVLVRLSLVSTNGEQPLTGTALVRHDESDAVVRATLDAVNRRFEALLE